MGFFMLFPTLATLVGMPVTGKIADVMGPVSGMKVAAILPLIGLILVSLIRPRPTAEAKVGRGLKL